MSAGKLAIEDRIDLMQTCLQAVADLVAPRDDLQEKQLDGLAILMDFLLKEQAAALAELVNS